MGHPVEYDSGSSLAIFLRISFFSLAFHHFFTIFSKGFFFLSIGTRTQWRAIFLFFSNCVYHCFQVVCFNILGRGSRMYVCRHAPNTQFSKIVSIEGRFCSSFTILSSCFVFSLGACFRGFQWVPFSKSYLISSWVVVIKSWIFLEWS